MKHVFFALVVFYGQSLSAEPFDGLSEAIASGGYGSLKSVVVSRHGEIIYEDYFLGTQAGDLHQVHSVTKSIGSALIGIAHRQGAIDLDQSLGHFFGSRYPMAEPPYRDKRLISVRAVLQQRHGIALDEWALDYTHPQNPVVEMINSGDWYRYVLTRPMDDQPGEKFTYSTGVSTLMSRMIRQATGRSPRQFAMQELFGPLGIQSVHWELYSDMGMGYGLTEWPNPDGDEPLGFGLWLSPTDMVRFGELYLNGGVYNGRRILDKAWVNASWTLFSNSQNTPYFAGYPGSGYGYQWWAQAFTDDRGRTWTSHYAAGWARQHILVFPELDLVVASVADDYSYGGPGIGALLRSIILPALNPRLDARFDGAWYNPGTAGQGLTLEILNGGEELLGFWFTYGQGYSKRWFLIRGRIAASEAELSIIETDGGVFLQSDPVTETEWGVGRFTAIDCNHISFELESPEVIASIPLERLTGTCAKP
jgi:CubicO group peptidase (beta-lactamase class C family)